MRRLSKYLLSLGGVIVAVWAFRGAEVSIPNVPNIVDYLGRMVPPDTGILGKIWKPLIETIQIAIVSIILSSIVAIPCSFLAAKNVMSNGAAYQAARAALGVLRGIPPLLYALIFVSMVGLGPFAGVLALTCHCIGALGRFCAEAVESINPEIMDSAKATGANKLKTVVYAILPELKVLFLGYVLYYFEYNVRTSTVLGLVGAGGIGLTLITSIHLFKYQEVATIMLVIITVIVLMDRTSAIIRGRLV